MVLFRLLVSVFVLILVSVGGGLIPAIAETKVRTITYRVETRGVVTKNQKLTFAKIAAQIYADDHGWGQAKLKFKAVTGKAHFSLVLATPQQVVKFSNQCSVKWSCRVGRYVIINKYRWFHASAPWRKAKQSLLNYRRMVVNHETGHWLGLGHAYCPGKGKLAPVMMQQSKGLQGCRFNPWPLSGELTKIRR